MEGGKSTREEIYEVVQAAVAPILGERAYSLAVGTQQPWTYTVHLSWREGKKALGLRRDISVKELVHAPDYHEWLRCWARGIGLAVTEQIRMAALAGSDLDSELTTWC